jgi:DNA repair exonuclease SbcCD nuclease subunit
MSNDKKRYLLYSDLHLTNKNKHYKRDGDGLSDLLKRQMDFLKFLYSEGEKNKVDGIIFLGDLTDEDMIDTYVLSCLFELAKLAKNASFPSYFIEGNHGITDRKNKYSIIGSLSALLPNCFFECQLHRERINIKDKNVDLYFLPYGNFKEMQDLCANLQPQEDTDCNVLFLHGPVINAEMDNGLPSQHGLELTEETLEVFNLTIAGDFHRPQSMNIGSQPFVYCGAPFALTRGQEFDKLYRELVIEIEEDNISISLVNHENPFQMKLLSFDYDIFKQIKDLSIFDDQVTLIIDEIPSVFEKEALENILSSLNLYNYKLKVKNSRSPSQTIDPIEKSKLSDDQILKLVAKRNISDSKLLEKVEKIVNKIVTNQN